MFVKAQMKILDEMCEFCEEEVIKIREGPDCLQVRSILLRKAMSEPSR